MREKGPDLFQADPHRIAVIGRSPGGYLTLMAGFCLNPRPQALVAFYGYGDIAGRGHGFDREMQAPEVAAAFDRVMAFLKKYLAQ